MNVSKPKALLVMHLPPPIYGATIANKYILESNTISDKFEVDFVNLATNDELDKVQKFTFKKVLIFFRLLIEILKKNFKCKYDVAFVSLTACGPAFYKDLLVVSVLKVFSNNIVYFFHNKGVEKASEKKMNHLLYRFVFNNTKSIILSKHLYADIKKYVANENVFYCPYGIPEVQQFQKERTSGQCKLLFLGNMMLEKGVLILLEACKILKSKNIDFFCDYVGGWTDITEQEFRQHITHCNLEKNVTVHGPKYGGDKKKFFETSDIFVFPTYYHYETFGLVNLEAMQHSLPVVSTHEGGIPDVVMDGVSGLLVPKMDAQILAAKLEWLILNPSVRTSMGEEGLKRYKSHFTISQFESNLCRILLQISNGKLERVPRIMPVKEY